MTRQTIGRMSEETKRIFVPQKKKTKPKGLVYGIFTLCAVFGLCLGAGFAALSATTTFASDIKNPVVAYYEATPVYESAPEPPAVIFYEPEPAYIEETVIVEIIVEEELYEYIEYECKEPDEKLYKELYEEPCEGPEIPEPVVFVPVLQNPIPQARCYFKSWMDWRAITYRNSRQWRMQQIAYTCDYGFRRVDGLYMIALGTYFLYSGVGDVFDITLSSGVTFRAVVGDIKSDRHTDPTNRFHISDGSVIEFVVDRQIMCRRVLSRGNISYAGFPGTVESIVRVPELFIAV